MTKNDRNGWPEAIELALLGKFATNEEEKASAGCVQQYSEYCQATNPSVKIHQCKNCGK